MELLDRDIKRWAGVIERAKFPNNRRRGNRAGQAARTEGSVMTNLDIGLIGYGEVGKIFGNELRAKGVSWIGAWDVKFADAAAGSAERRHAQAHRVVACESARELCSKAQLIISAVTASNTPEVAKEAARWIGRGATFLDFNSASPGTSGKPQH